MQDEAFRPAWNSYQTKALIPSPAGRAILENEGLRFWSNPPLALGCGGDNAWLSGSFSGALLPVLPRVRGAGRRAVDGPSRGLFLSDLPAQIPDSSLVHCGHTW